MLNHSLLEKNENHYNQIIAIVNRKLQLERLQDKLNA